MGIPNKVDPDLMRDLLQKGLGAEAVARACGCNHGTVAYWRAKLDIAPKDAPRRRLDYDLVRRLHADRLSDRDIGARVGCTPGAVRQIRVKLGLSTHGKGSLSFQEKMRANYFRRCAAAGVTSLRTLGGGRFRKRSRELARRYGLPEDLFRWQVLALVALAGGPATAGELADRLGRGPGSGPNFHRWNCSQCPGGNYLTDLVRRGLAAHLQPGRMYTLTPLAMDLLTKGSQS